MLVLDAFIIFVCAEAKMCTISVYCRTASGVQCVYIGRLYNMDLTDPLIRENAEKVLHT